MMDGRDSGSVLEVAGRLGWGLNVLFSPSSDAPIGFISGYYGVPGDWAERLLWKGMREACVRRHSAGSSGHHAGMQRVDGCTQKGKAVKVTLLITCAKDPHSC